MKVEELYQKAVQKWGEKQIEMVIEECSELVLAIQKFRRNSKFGLSTIALSEEVIDEVADLTIMMQQMRQILGKDNVDKRIEIKLKRLADRLGEDPSFLKIPKSYYEQS